MGIEELRRKHPRLVYESYSFKYQETLLTLSFTFRLEPDVIFQPEVILPINKEIDMDVIRNFVFHLGLIEAISYWKVACPQELVIKAGKLSPKQVAWWHDLFIHGLGEFFYINNIDFNKPDFLNIYVDNNEAPEATIHRSKSANGDLILVGGGKDSGVTLVILKNTPWRKGVMALNPTRSALENTEITQYKNLLEVKRKIDPNLLALNRKGYLNGHTPFSAYLAFLGTLVGVLHNYKNIIVSNERSASKGNIIFHGVEVNHQYSKSLRFEKLFRQYLESYLSKDIQYFSFLRPLFDLQISKLFATYSELHKSYRSCNVNQKFDSWCAKCPKCAFVYMSIFPYISDEQVENIFGRDYYLIPEIGEHIKDLVGMGEHKPFECVGTEEESKLAIALSVRKYRANNKEVPSLLLELENKLGLTENDVVALLEERVNNTYGNENFLPEEHAVVLKDAISSIIL